MSVRVRGKGVYFVDVRWPDGMRTRKDMPDKATAIKVNRKIKVAVVDEARIWSKLRKELGLDKHNALTFSELADLYLSKYVKSYNRDIRTTTSRLNALKAFFKNIPLGSMNPGHKASFIGFKHGDEASNATINRYLSLLSSMMNWAIEQGIIESNPLGKYSKLKEPQWVGWHPEEKELDAIFDRIDSAFLPIFAFLRETGCRKGEAMNLRHSQINYAKNVITVHGKTKSGKARQVPLTDRGLWSVQALPNQGQTVFYHPIHLKPFTGDNLGWIWDKARGGSELRIHDLRHAFAIKLAEDGCPMHFISEVLGHHSVDFTRKRYARFSPDSASRSVLRVLQGRKASVGNSGAMGGI